jgi:hypothetical protein
MHTRALPRLAERCLATSQSSRARSTHTAQRVTQHTLPAPWQRTTNKQRPVATSPPRAQALACAPRRTMRAARKSRRSSGSSTGARGWAKGVGLRGRDRARPSYDGPARWLARRLASATTLDEHNAALQGFDEDMTLDTPFIQLQVRQERAVTSQLPARPRPLCLLLTSVATARLAHKVAPHLTCTTNTLQLVTRAVTACAHCWRCPSSSWVCLRLSRAW